MNGIRLIEDERQRQIHAEGWSPDHDDGHEDAQLVAAAESYLLAASYVQGNKKPEQLANLKSKPPRFWPWDKAWWKPVDDPIRNLVKAGALIAAEIDRLQRLSPPPPSRQWNDVTDVAHLPEPTESEAAK